jgi:hypothetical protein
VFAESFVRVTPCRTPKIQLYPGNEKKGRFSSDIHRNL